MFNEHLVFQLIMIGLIVTVAACLFDFYRRPWHIARRFAQTMERWKIKTPGTGEYPLLKRVRRSPYKEHELMLEIDGKGMDLVTLDRHTDHLKAGLNGLIRMEYGKKNGIIHIYLTSQKYVRPAVISPRDNAIGAISIQHLINLLVIGPTGTGKSVVTKIVTRKIVNCFQDFTIWLLDFKKFDFQGYAKTPHYYGYTDCLQGLKDYYAVFKAQQEKGVAGEPQYLIIDEWGSFITSLERKEAEQAKNMLAELLMLGRAYRFIPIIGIQRPDASYFQGSRDNFHVCLALGNLSPEGRRMVFPDSAKDQITDCKKREGHLYIDGVGLEKIQIEEIPNLDALDKAILEAIER